MGISIPGLAAMGGAFQAGAGQLKENLQYTRARTADIQKTLLDQIMANQNADPRVIGDIIDSIYGKGSSEGIGGLPAIVRAQGLLQPKGYEVNPAGGAPADTAGNQSVISPTNNPDMTNQSIPPPAAQPTQSTPQPVSIPPLNTAPTAEDVSRLKNLANIIGGIGPNGQQDMASRVSSVQAQGATPMIPQAFSPPPQQVANNGLRPTMMGNNTGSTSVFAPQTQPVAPVTPPIPGQQTQSVRPMVPGQVSPLRMPPGPMTQAQDAQQTQQDSGQAPFTSTLDMLGPNTSENTFGFRNAWHGQQIGSVADGRAASMLKQLQQQYPDAPMPSLIAEVAKSNPDAHGFLQAYGFDNSSDISGPQTGSVQDNLGKSNIQTGLDIKQETADNQKMIDTARASGIVSEGELNTFKYMSDAKPYEQVNTANAWNKIHPDFQIPVPNGSTIPYYQPGQAEAAIIAAKNAEVQLSGVKSKNWTAYIQSEEKKNIAQSALAAAQATALPLDVQTRQENARTASIKEYDSSQLGVANFERLKTDDTYNQTVTQEGKLGSQIQMLQGQVDTLNNQKAAAAKNLTNTGVDPKVPGRPIGPLQQFQDGTDAEIAARQASIAALKSQYDQLENTRTAYVQQASQLQAPTVGQPNPGNPATPTSGKHTQPTGSYADISVNADAIPTQGKAILHGGGQIQIGDKIIGMVNGKPQVVGMAGGG